MTINEYVYVPDDTLKILKFSEMTEEWLDFIVSCRLGNPHDYDIVEGPMANDTIFNFVQNFSDGKFHARRSGLWQNSSDPHIKSAFTRFGVVSSLGEKTLRRIYKYADVFHCEPIEKTAPFAAKRYLLFEISTHWPICRTHTQAK